MNEPVTLPPLPIGRSGFEVIRKKGNLYVDKTALIYDLLTGDSNFIALSAPRRFGKSLTLSTIGSVFEHGTQYCEGLAIEKLWTENTYLTISIDFSTFDELSSFEKFRDQFRDRLASVFAPHDFEAPAESHFFYNRLDSWFKGMPDHNLVVLIDEYDAPLTQVVDQPDLLSLIQQELSAFFKLLKSNNDRFRFLFITGVTRYSHTGIYSGPNFIEDISLEPKYASLLGYTQNELEKYFAGYIEHTALKLNMSKDELLAQMKEYYDGFCLDLSAKTHVYNPWSVLEFFSKHRFDNFWFQTAGNHQLLLTKLLSDKYNQIEKFDQPITRTTRQLKASVEYSLLDPNVILFDTGYLTIAEADGNELTLTLPNLEVRQSIAELLVKLMTTYMPELENLSLRKLLKIGDLSQVIKYLNCVFASLDYNRYALRDEASFQAIIQVLMLGNDLKPVIEQHQAGGRTDIELTHGDFHYVFELKYADEETNPERKLKEAVKQIKDNRYGAHVYGKKLKRVALVFSDKTKSVHYQEVSDELDASIN